MLLHGAVLAAVVAWTPQMVEAVRTYEVELVTVRPVVQLTAELPAPAPKKAEPPSKPPEPKQEIPPPKPPPAPLRVAAVAKPAPAPVAHVPVPASVVQSPLRMAVAMAAPTPAPVAVTLPATNSAPAVVSGRGTEEVSDPAYLDTVRKAVARHLRYPELALRRGVEGRVVLRLTLDASGKLLASGAGEPADDGALLGAALAAVKRAAPFPPWQGTHDTGATLNLTLPIRFRLDER